MKISRKKSRRKEEPDNQLSLFGGTDGLTTFTRYCHRTPSSNSKQRLNRQEQLTIAYRDNLLYRERLIELKKNIQVFSSLDLSTDVVGLSDANVPVGESSPRAKYTNHDVLLCIDLRLEGWTLKQISEKMDVPIRTLRDIFEGRRRAVLPTRFK